MDKLTNYLDNTLWTKESLVLTTFIKKNNVMLGRYYYTNDGLLGMWTNDCRKYDHYKYRINTGLKSIEDITKIP